MCNLKCFVVVLLIIGIAESQWELRSARRNEDDGYQVVEAAVMGRALSTRSCAGRTHVGAVSLQEPTSYTTMRRAEAMALRQIDQNEGGQL